MNKTKLPAAELPSVPGEPPPKALTGRETPPGAAEAARQGGHEIQGISVPPVLLEGDEPEAAPPRIEGPKAQISPPGEALKPEAPPSELPGSYGTGRLTLLPRDPGNLYAHWDLSEEQHRHYAELSADRQLRVRIHRESVSGPLVTELPVRRESNHGFIAVGTGGMQYVAELGYQPPEGTWKEIAASQPVFMPAAPTTEPQPIRFGTLRFPEAPTPSVSASETSVNVARAQPGPASGAPPALERQFPLPPPLRPISTEITQISPATGSDLDEQGELGASARQKLQRTTEPGELADLPAWVEPAPAGEWSEAQEAALAEIIAHSLLRREWLGSAEILQLLQGRLPGLAASELVSLASEGVVQPVSSEVLAQAPREQRGFWLNLNAELVLYGATQPDAQVTIGGQTIQLRADGTFSCRFALPDGFYHLSVAAISARGETRQAELDFSRQTDYSQAVGAAQQDPTLKPPMAQEVGSK